VTMSRGATHECALLQRDFAGPLTGFLSREGRWLSLELTTANIAWLASALRKLSSSCGGEICVSRG